MTEARCGYSWSVRVHGEVKAQDYGTVDIMDTLKHEPGEASTGASMTAGTSQNFGKVKVEASAWCTLPCKPEDIRAVNQVARELVKEDVKEAFREAHDAFMQLHEEYNFPLED